MTSEEDKGKNGIFHEVEFHCKQILCITYMYGMYQLLPSNAGKSQALAKNMMRDKWKFLNIVENQLIFYFELWCLCCIMFRWINKQPGMQIFWNWCSRYQEIYMYDWISSFNKVYYKQSSLLFILTQADSSLWGKMSMVNLVTCLFVIIIIIDLAISWSARVAKS